MKQEQQLLKGVNLLKKLNEEGKSEKKRFGKKEGLKNLPSKFGIYGILAFSIGLFSESVRTVRLERLANYL